MVDARSDIFSLGSILYEAATGVRPFHGDSTLDTLHKIVHSEPDPLAQRVPDAPLQFQWILRKALAKSPAERYQSARDLVVDLKALRRDLDSDSNLPTVVSGHVPATAAGGRRRSPILWAAVAGVALIAVAGLFWTLGRQTAAPVVDMAAPAALTMRSITASGLVTSAAISPDGKYLVYVESLQGEQSLNLRQIGGAQSLQLIAPNRVGYWGTSFNPDGTAVIYAVKSDKDPAGAIYQISTLGGFAQKVGDGSRLPGHVLARRRSDGLECRQISGTGSELGHGRQLGWQRVANPGHVRVSRSGRSDLLYGTLLVS